MSPLKIRIYYKEREKEFIVKELSRHYLNQIIRIIPPLMVGTFVDVACPPENMAMERTEYLFYDILCQNHNDLGCVMRKYCTYST